MTCIRFNLLGLPYCIFVFFASSTIMIYHLTRRVINTRIWKQKSKKIEDPFKKLPQDVLVHLLSYLEVKDLASISQTSKYFRDISDSDVIWKNHFGTVSNSEQCSSNFLWRYKLDAENTKSKCCYGSKGNFKQCFYSDDLHSKVNEELKKQQEDSWLKKIKWLHYLPQKQITCFLLSMFAFMSVLRIDRYMSLSWSVIFLPLWILLAMIWGSIFSAWLTKVHYPHLLYRLERGFYYRLIVKEVSSHSAHPTPKCETGAARNNPFKNFLKKRSWIRIWYTTLVSLQCIVISLFLSSLLPFSWLICVPYLLLVFSYNLLMFLCTLAPEGCKKGLALSWTTTPLLNFILASSFVTNKVVVGGICLLGTISVLLFLLSRQSKNCWEHIKYRENLISGWCLGNCLSGAFMFGLFVTLRLTKVVDWSFFTVLTPFWLINVFLIVLASVAIFNPSFFRLSRYEQKSTIIGILFIMFPCLMMEIWLYLSIDGLLSFPLSYMLFVLFMFELSMACVASRYRLFLKEEECK